MHFTSHHLGNEDDQQHEQRDYQNRLDALARRHLIDLSGNLGYLLVREGRDARVGFAKINAEKHQLLAYILALKKSRNLFPVAGWICLTNHIFG